MLKKVVGKKSMFKSFYSEDYKHREKFKKKKLYKEFEYFI